jgi:hypothetical protein
LFLFWQGSPFFLLHKSQYLAFSNFLFGEGLRILKRDSPDFKIAFLTPDLIPLKLLKEQISTLHFIPDLIKASARFSKLIRHFHSKTKYKKNSKIILIFLYMKIKYNFVNIELRFKRNKMKIKKICLFLSVFLIV